MDAGDLGDGLAVGAGLFFRAGDTAQLAIGEVVGATQLEGNDVLVDHRAVDSLALDDRPDQAFLARARAAVLLAPEDGRSLDRGEALALRGLDGLLRGGFDRAHAALRWAARASVVGSTPIMSA